jgi:hypothetical protein
VKYSVTAPKSLSTLEAEQVRIDNGVLIFTDVQGAVLVAIAPGHWISVRHVDIEPQAKPA